MYFNKRARRVTFLFCFFTVYHSSITLHAQIADNLITQVPVIHMRLQTVPLCLDVHYAVGLLVKQETTCLPIDCHHKPALNATLDI
jgi:hypothetical protein